MLLIPVVQQRGSVIHIYTYSLSFKEDIKRQSILKINLCQRILSDTPFLKLFLKFSLCRVSLAVGLSLLAVGGLLTAVPLLLPTSGLVPCLGLELLCALSQGLLLPGLSKKSSLSPGGPRAEVRRERDLPLQLRACLSAVPSAQGGAELSARARWKAGPPWSTPGMLGSFNGPEPGGPESTIRK